MYAKIVNETTKIVSIAHGDKIPEGYSEMEVEQAYNGSWYVKGYTPEKSQEEKETEVRAVRAEYFEKYVDFYQSKPLYWEELDDSEKQLIAEYRIYLKDYTKQDGWFNSNPMTYEEWLVAVHPISEGGE